MDNSEHKLKVLEHLHYKQTEQFVNKKNEKYKTLTFTRNSSLQKNNDLERQNFNENSQKSQRTLEVRIDV